MNVSELYDLTIWVNDEIKAAQLPKKYKVLLNLLQQAAQPNQPKNPFDSQKEDLLSGLRGVPLVQLSREQLNFLGNLGIEKYVGEEGVRYVEDVLFRNVIDVATAAEKIGEALNSINQGIAKSDQIHAGLADCFEPEEYEESGEVLVRVVFSGDASMQNVVDFKDWGRIWYEIGRGLTQAHGTAPEDIRVIGATRGSIVLELAAAAAIVTSLSTILVQGLKVAEKVLNVKKAAEEVRGLKLKNDKLAADIEAEIENEKAEGVASIVEAQVDIHGLERRGDGDKVKDLERAIKHLIDFIESGGQIDFVLPDEDDEEEGDGGAKQIEPEYAKLRITFEEIRRLETKIRLLEHKDK